MVTSSGRIGPVSGPVELLLLVWFLLQPPVAGGRVLLGASLGSWIVNGRFPTQEACESTRSMNLAALYYGEATGGTNADEVARRSVITSSRCISEDALRAQLGGGTPSPASSN